MPYFDVASAAPLHPVAREALLASLEEGWADPARLYREGRRARMLLDAARETLAELLSARPADLVFTASGSDAVRQGVLGALPERRPADGSRARVAHLVVSAVEHSSVLRLADAHHAAGGALTTVGVDRDGRLRAADFETAVRTEGTALACLQSANHEVGTVQPVEWAAGVCAERGVPLLVDAAQTLGRRAPPDGWSLLAGSARKWGGPPGVGVLATRRGLRLPDPGPEFGVVENGNLPAVVAAAAALRAVRAEAQQADTRLSALVDRVRARVPELVSDVRVLGDPRNRLPHLVAFSCLYAHGEEVLSALDREGFSVSSGSSCTADIRGAVEEDEGEGEAPPPPSHVLAAMGVLSGGNIRVSLPSSATAEDVERFLQVLPDVVAQARGSAGPLVESGSAAVADAFTSASGLPETVREETATDTGEVVQHDSPALTLDTLGRRCPIPVIELARRITEVPVGAVLAVRSDDQAAAVDIPAWCEMRDQEYLGDLPVSDAEREDGIPGAEGAHRTEAPDGTGASTPPKDLTTSTEATAQATGPKSRGHASAPPWEYLIRRTR